jgi:hypothetical protein
VREPPGAAIMAILNGFQADLESLGAGPVATLSFRAQRDTRGKAARICVEPGSVNMGPADGGADLCVGQTTCGEIRIDPTCVIQGDCNCDGKVNSGDLVCLIAKFFDPTLQGRCECEDCNLSGQINSADATCITLCAFGECVTG